MQTQQPHVRNPRTAKWLSFGCLGLGQIYCGRVGRGLIMLGSGGVILGLIVLLTTLLQGSTFVVSLSGLVLLIVAGTGLAIWSAYDAQAIARHMAPLEYEPRDYNQGLVYALLLLQGLPIAVAVAFLIKTNTVEAFVLPSQSMSPTFVPGDHILASKYGVQFRQMQRGEVVIFRNPRDRHQHYIKRIVGLPGDTVELKQGRLLVNDQETIAPPAAEPQLAVEERPADFPKLAIPANSYFVLGDNYHNSLDSRQFGCIPHGDIVGMVEFIYWPGDTWSRFGRLR